MQLTQPQIALMIGFSLSLGVELPADFPSWDGTDLTSFSLGKWLANETTSAQGACHD
jgi:hypothetical protein